MEEKLIEVLETFGLPVLRQGCLSQDERYPDSFFTFWNNDSSGKFHSNAETSVIWDFDVNFYSTDPELTYSKLSEAITRLKAKRFIISGRGHDLLSDEPTHTGRGVNALYLETINR